MNTFGSNVLGTGTADTDNVVLTIDADSILINWMSYKRLFAIADFDDFLWMHSQVPIRLSFKIILRLSSINWQNITDSDGGGSLRFKQMTLDRLLFTQ
ncbi:MAG: hypothetical protein R3C11_14435 [Planctomycetaceae bacterium]